MEAFIQEPPVNVVLRELVWGDPVVLFGYLYCRCPKLARGRHGFKGWWESDEQGIVAMHLIDDWECDPA